MQVNGIIAEYNPFHNGHLKQLRLAKRETEADILAVVMSGSFTQHGDICVCDRSTRAQWAMQAGADLVLELPTIYSLSHAQRFAEGALKTLSMLGEYTLSFGTEADELHNLSMAAEFMQSETKDMSGLLKGYLGQGYSVAKSRTMALGSIRPDIANMLTSPNNILAVEYIKASHKYGGNVHLHSVERKPDDGKKYLSSTKIRELMRAGNDITPYVPQYVTIDRPVSTDKYGTIATYAMKAMTAAQLADIYNVGEGLENRISQADFNDMRGFLELTSKRYTRSTIKRIAACVTLGLDKRLAELAATEKPYCTLLAVKPSKKKFILPLLAEADGYFFYKHSDCGTDCPVRPLVDLDEKANKIQKLCL